MTLNREKVGLMIKSYLAGNLDIPQDAFIQLCKCYESLGELDPVLLTPPRATNMIPNPPKKKNIPRNINITTQNVFIVKDENMMAVIQELEYNPLYIKMQQICEVC